MRLVDKDTAKPPKERWIAVLAAALLVLGGSLLFFRGAFDASNCDFNPDSVEYASAGRNLVDHGRCEITLAGHGFPSRYPPWFSTLVAAPAYLVFGREPGNPVYAVLAFALFGLLAAFWVGRRLGGTWGGVASATGLALLPTFALYARQILADVPSTTLALVAAGSYLRLREREAGQAWYWLSGAAAALATGFRPLGGFLVLPAVMAILMTRPAHRGRRLIALLLPVVVVIVGNAVFNARTFGSPLRTGYSFWCSVPYDYTALTFSGSYVLQNLRSMWTTGLPILVVAAVAIGLLRGKTGGPDAAPIQLRLRYLAEFALYSFVPLLGFHFFYFFSADRFFLPILAVALVAAGGALGSWIPRRWERLALLIPLLLVICGAYARLTKPPDAPFRRLGVERIRRLTPVGSTILTGLDPVYTAFILGADDSREIIPLSRDVEYASKLITPRRIPAPDPPPRGPFDHRCAGLVKAGAHEAVEIVVAERPALIAERLQAGRAVFLDATFVQPGDVAAIRALQASFTLEKVGEELFRVSRVRKAEPDR